MDNDNPWFYKAFGPGCPDIVFAEHFHHAAPGLPQYAAYIKYGQDQTGQDQMVDCRADRMYPGIVHSSHGQYPKLDCKQIDHH